MAREAERLLTDTGWLPEPLRITSDEASATAPVDSPSAATNGASDGSSMVDLPAFLTSDEEGEDDEAAADPDADRQVPPAMAAE